MEKPNFYSIIPAYVRYSSDINSFEKILYSEITALCDKNGYCFASNNYFSKVFEKHRNSISRSLKILEKAQFIRIDIDQDKGNFRKIYLKNVNSPITKNCVTPNTKNCAYNNTSINNVSLYRENEKNNDVSVSSKNAKKEKTNKKKIDLIFDKLSEFEISNQLEKSISNFLEYITTKKSLTTHSINLLADHIYNIIQSYDQSEIVKSINDAIMKGWTSFHPDWNNKPTKKKNNRNSRSDVFSIWD